MRTRVIATAVAVALLTTMIGGAADAGKKKRVARTASEDYFGAVGPRGTADTPCVAAPIGCVRFEVKPSERFVTVEIVDGAGEPIYASVYVYGYSDGTDSHEHICGKTESPLPIAKGVEELVITTAQTTGGVTNPCPGPVTTGTVTATFSNLP